MDISHKMREEQKSLCEVIWFYDFSNSDKNLISQRIRYKQKHWGINRGCKLIAMVYIECLCHSPEADQCNFESLPQHISPSHHPDPCNPLNIQTTDQNYPTSLKKTTEFLIYKFQNPKSEFGF